MAEKKEHMIVLVENYWEGYFQSIVWLLTLAAFMGYAVWIGSSAMQWIMGIFWFLMMVSITIDSVNKRRFTIEDARKRLDEIEREANKDTTK